MWVQKELTFDSQERWNQSNDKLERALLHYSLLSFNLDTINRISLGLGHREFQKLKRKQEEEDGEEEDELT